MLLLVYTSSLLALFILYAIVGALCSMWGINRIFFVLPLQTPPPPPRNLRMAPSPKSLCRSGGPLPQPQALQTAPGHTAATCNVMPAPIKL